MNIGYSAAGLQRPHVAYSTTTSIKAMRIDQVGVKPCMYEAAATWPNWPAAATFTPYDHEYAQDFYMSIFFTEGEDDEAGISSITAYIAHTYPSSYVTPHAIYQAALYDADGALLGTTATVTRTLAQKSAAWVEFTFATPLSRDAGEPLYIALWAAPNGNYTTWFHGHPDGLEDQDYWEPIPPDPPAPDGGSGPAGPLFTGGGML